MNIPLGVAVLVGAVLFVPETRALHDKAGLDVLVRLGPPKVVIIGLALETAGLLVLGLFITTTTSVWLIAAPLVVDGLGLGLASAQLTVTVLADIPMAISGQGSATQSTVRQLGAALGSAIMGRVLAHFSVTRSTELLAAVPCSRSCRCFCPRLGLRPSGGGHFGRIGHIRHPGVDRRCCAVRAVCRPHCAL